MDTTVLVRFAVLSMVLFVLGAFGVLWRRNLLVSLMSLQLMFAAGQLALVVFDRVATVDDGGLHGAGQAFALVALAIGVAQLVVGIATVGSLVRQRHSVNVEDASSMRW